MTQVQQKRLFVTRDPPASGRRRAVAANRLPPGGRRQNIEPGPWHGPTWARCPTSMRLSPGLGPTWPGAHLLS